MKVTSPELEQFRREVVNLNVQWQMFEELFSDSSNYIVFNRAGPLFWNHFQAYLLDAIFSGISRFFDPANNGYQTNLSLETVINFPEMAPIRSELFQRRGELVLVWEKGIKIWRNKKLSHSDLDTSLAKSPLPEVPFSEVKQLVDGISDFAREIDHQLNQIDMSYKISLTKWTPDVLRCLRAGIEKMDSDSKH